MLPESLVIQCYIKRWTRPLQSSKETLFLQPHFTLNKYFATRLLAFDLCFLYENWVWDLISRNFFFCCRWWNFFVVIFYVLAPIPTMISKRSGDLGNTSSSLKEACAFFTTGIVLSAFALPIVLCRAGVVSLSFTIFVTGK